MNQSLEETINLAVFADNAVVVIERIESPKALRTNLVLGGHLPAHCTAFGKTFLADMTEDALERFVSEAPLEPFTKNTITAIQALKKELARVRKDGFALDNQELAEGVHCIAAPIKDESKRVIAAVSVSTPSSRISKEQLLAFKPSIVGATTEMSRILGFRQ